MNKEQEELLGAAYKRYLIEDARILPNMSKEKMTELGFRLTKEEFINKCKTDNEFSEMWGLKIEERELSSDERYNLLSESEKKNFIITMRPMMSPDDKYDEVHYTIDNYYEHIPKRAITISYNDKTIESYE